MLCCATVLHKLTRMYLAIRTEVLVHSLTIARAYEGSRLIKGHAVVGVFGESAAESDPNAA